MAEFSYRFIVHFLFCIFILVSLSIFIDRKILLPQVDSVEADSQNKTFIFSTTSEGWISNKSGGNTLTLSWSGSDGSPATGSLRTYDTKTQGGTTTSSNYWQWSGTWEDLGIPAGHVVSSINGTYMYKVAQFGNSTSETGPFEFRTGASCTLTGSLTPREYLSTSTNWITTSGSTLSVPSAFQSSNSQICLRLYNSANLAGGNKTFELFQDTIALNITHTPPAVVSVSITSDGVISYGTLGFGESKSTIELSDTQTALNDGNTAEDFNIKTSAPSGWDIGQSPSNDTFVLEYSTDNGNGWISFTASDNYQTLANNIPVNTSQNFDLKLTAPNPSTSATEKTITITIQAVQH